MGDDESSYWPAGDQQPNATPAEIEFAGNWRDTPKVVFSSTIDKVDWNTRLVTSDAVAEITRLQKPSSASVGVLPCRVTVSDDGGWRRRSLAAGMVS